MNHFEILGLTAQFELNVSSISIKYRELQRQYHPDKFVTASEAQKLLALQKSTQINDAYQTLVDPIRRAEYLLFLHGIALKDEQQSIKDSDFLMEQMELRETLASIEENADESQLGNFSDKIIERYQARLKEIALLLNTENWQAAADSVRKIKFLAKLQSEIERIEERLF